MPGFLTHLVVLDRATDRLLDDRDARMQAIGRILRDNREAASTGAIGPDVTFFMDAPPVAQALLKAVEYLREFKEKLKPIREGIDDVERFLPNVDRLSGGMISQLGEYFSAAFATIIAAAERFAAQEFDVFQYLKLPLQESQREEDWFWFDMLHYRSTGPFSRELITRAGTNAELQAYAYGYMSHLAVDTVGHAFVNSVVGAPYRCLWQRHHTVDNYIDVWAARHYWSREMLASQVYTRYFPRANAESPAALPRALADMLVDATRNVYTGKPHPDGGRMAGREFPNRSDWQNTYRDLFNVLEFSTGGVPMERPERPKFPDIDVRDLLPPPPHVPSPSDYDDPGVALLALFFWPLYLARAAKEWVEEVVARIMEMAEAPARHIIRLFLYEMQMMLYHTFRAHHRALALRGYVYGYSDELQNDEESGLWRVPRVDANYPHREDTNLWQRPWRWPDSPFEPATTWPGPYPVGSTPISFIEDAVQSEDVYRGLTAPTGPRDVTGVTAPLISTGGDPRPGLGNAVDLFVRMVRSAVDNETIPNFNLDADRGYGWPCWTWRDGAGGPSSGSLVDADIEFRRGKGVV